MVKLVNPERFNHLPDAILFDTDDTLYKYAPAHAAAMQAVREKVTRTLSIQPEAFDKAFAEAKQQVKKPPQAYSGVTQPVTLSAANAGDYRARLASDVGA